MISCLLKMSHMFEIPFVVGGSRQLVLGDTKESVASPWKQLVTGAMKPGTNKPNQTPAEKEEQNCQIILEKMTS